MRIDQSFNRKISILESAKRRVVKELIELMGIQLERKGSVPTSQLQENIIGYDFSSDRDSINLYLYHNRKNDDYYIKYKQGGFTTKIRIEEEEFDRIVALLAIRSRADKTGTVSDTAFNFHRKMNEDGFTVPEDFEDTDQENPF